MTKNIKENTEIELDRLTRSMEIFNEETQKKLKELIEIFKSEFSRLKHPNDITDKLETLEKIENTFSKFEDKCEMRENRLLERLHKMEKETLKLSKEMYDLNKNP